MGGRTWGGGKGGETFRSRNLHVSDNRSADETELGVRFRLRLGGLVV
jgi:hypothetical protein